MNSIDNPDDPTLALAVEMNEGWPVWEADDGDEQIGWRNGRRPSIRFPAPVRMSEIANRPAPPVEWVLQGFIPRDGISLLFGEPKAGKTTWMTRLFAAMAKGAATFCGQPLNPCSVVMVTQENVDLWNQRVRRFGFGEVVHRQEGPNGYPQPFEGTPTWPQWDALIQHLADMVAKFRYGLVVFDTIARFWPVDDENQATQVEKAVAPLGRIPAAGAGVLLIHHSRKTGGPNGRAVRGSNALPGEADVAIELKERAGNVRAIETRSRYEETPKSLLVRLTPTGYVATKDKAGRSPSVKQPAPHRWSHLPMTPPGLTANQLAAKDGHQPRTLREQLSRAAKVGDLRKEGSGTKTDPYRFWRPS